MHLAEPIKVFLAMRRVKREGKHLLLKFKSRPHGVFGVWHLLKSHYEKWVQKSPEALRHPGFLGWHPLRMHNMVAGVGLEPHDLRVMSPTSYQLLYPAIYWIWCGAGDRGRTGTVFPPRDFKSLASACSATPAESVTEFSVLATCIL